jgi:hypothetical protein
MRRTKGGSEGRQSFREAAPPRSDRRDRRSTLSLDWRRPWTPFACSPLLLLRDRRDDDSSLRRGRVGVKGLERGSEGGARLCSQAAAADR